MEWKNKSQNLNHSTTWGSYKMSDPTRTKLNDAKPNSIFFQLSLV